ncbi:MAG: filamentous hemagglutinin N-terminal domain-containing protein, partial [Gammaproteobacteria bacterium]|nr:filamentous hemagglutinin N-terminal domain-containing protein [Gammaproteobacteria bacterium]
ESAVFSAPEESGKKGTLPFFLDKGESAVFSAPEESGILNVISQVTGGSPSEINGTLGSSIPGADLYFFNPAGMAFGADASLDIQGSLYVSMADYLRLGTDGRFDAAQPEQTRLSIAPPRAFGFLDHAPAALSVDGAELRVPDGKTAAFIGGDVQLRNNDLKVKDGLVIVTAMASEGEASLEPLTDSASGTITISNDITLRRVNLDVSGKNGGRIFIQGGKIFMDSGFIFADTGGNGQKGAGITIKAAEKFDADHNSIVSAEHLLAASGSLGDTGDITIEAPNVRIAGGARIATTSRSSGAAGNIAIKAKEAVIEAGGRINVNTGDKKNNTGTGNSGNLLIKAEKSLRISGEGSALWANVFSRGTGGRIHVVAPLVEIQEGGAIQAGTDYRGIGAGGDIRLWTLDKLGTVHDFVILANYEY